MNHNLLNLIQEKRAQLIGYETFSYQLLNSDIESLNELLNQREQIIVSINQIDSKINHVIELSDDKEVLVDCQKRCINRFELSSNYVEIYDGFESIHDSLLNIQRLETRIYERLAEMKSELHRHLVEVENVSKIKKYFETYETEMQDMTQVVRKTTKI